MTDARSRSEPPHIGHEWNYLTEDEQNEVRAWFRLDWTASEAHRVLSDKRCGSIDHAYVEAWSVGIFDDGDYYDQVVYYCRECADRMVAAGWYTPLVTLTPSVENNPYQEDE